MSLLDDLDSAALRHETACGDGALIWRVWNAGAGDPLVLLHGGSGSWRHWVRQIPRFAAARTVIAPDLPGLGDSAMPPEPHDPPHAARIVAAGLTQVLKTAQADLVGFSFGANIAGHVAAELGSRIRALALVGAGSLGLPRNPVVLERVRDKGGEPRVAAHRANLAALMIADPTRIDALALEIQERNTVLTRFRSRGFADAALLKAALTRTTMPLLALWGELDQVSVGHIPERIAAVRQVRPDAMAELIPTAGHWTMYEAPEAFDAALEGFLRRAA